LISQALSNQCVFGFKVERIKGDFKHMKFIYLFFKEEHKIDFDIFE